MGLVGTGLLIGGGLLCGSMISQGKGDSLIDFAKTAFGGFGQILQGLFDMIMGKSKVDREGNPSGTNAAQTAGAVEKFFTPEHYGDEHFMDSLSSSMTMIDGKQATSFGQSEDSIDMNLLAKSLVQNGTRMTDSSGVVLSAEESEKMLAEELDSRLKYIKENKTSGMIVEYTKEGKLDERRGDVLGILKDLQDTGRMVNTEQTHLRSTVLARAFNAADRTSGSDKDISKNITSELLKKYEEMGVELSKEQEKQLGKDVLNAVKSSKTGAGIDYSLFSKNMESFFGPGMPDLSNDMIGDNLYKDGAAYVKLSDGRAVGQETTDASSVGTPGANNDSAPGSSGRGVNQDVGEQDR